MLSLLKKKSEAANASQVPAWHPNFRNYEKLPDVKVVRTAFFVNAAAVFVALALLLYFGFQEWKLHAVRVQIADWQRQIDANKKGSEQAVAMFRRFQTEAGKIAEIDGFVKSKPAVSDLLIRLTQTLPPNTAIDSLDLRDNGMVMRLSVRGAAEAASGYATAYLEQLKADKQLGALFDEVKFTSTPTRNPSTSRMAVEFFLHLKGARK
jgi:hypothetical protein